MDPLSVTASVAGIATAGTAIASALFNVIPSIRDAPREIKDIAFGLQDLARVLKELHSTLRKGRKLFKERLFRSVRSAIGRINDLHEDIYHLLESSEGSMGRLLWTFRRSKTTKLLAEVEAHKTTVGLMATTMLLAIKERKFSKTESEESKETKEDGRERRRLRREAENMVQMTDHKMQDLQPATQREDRGTQTELTAESMNAASTHPALALESNFEVFTNGGNLDQAEPRPNQLERWDAPPNDTATWLYRLVFAETPVSERGPDHSIDQRVAGGALDKMSSFPESIDYNRVLHRLLSQWTTLTVYEIESTEDEESTQDPWENRLSQTVRLLCMEPDDSDDNTPDDQEPTAPRQSAVHHMPSLGEHRASGSHSLETVNLEYADEYGAASRQMQKPQALQSDWEQTWLPLCQRFIENPPLDTTQRDKEHHRLSESILQRMLLQLDEVEPGNSNEVRSRRRDLVHEVQFLLKTLDDTCFGR